MKKAITILAVLIVLVGAVFAENHTIQIKADVSSIIPVFSLQFNGAKSVASTTKDTAETIVTDEETGATAPNPEYLQYSDRYGLGNHSDDTAVLAGFKLDKGGSVTVYAVLLNKAKQIETYDLTFSDGVFDVKRQGRTENETLAPTSITTAALANTAGCVANLENRTGADGGAANRIVKLTFDGQTVQSTNLQLASATYTYQGDDTIDMLEADQYYYADIVLTVSAT